MHCGHGDTQAQAQTGAGAALIILAIETSCDETAVCLMDDGGRVLADVIVSQMDIHKAYGGVVPEIASRKHLEMLPFVVREALTEANLTFGDIDAVAVTFGPGLAGALLCGVNYAKGLAFALGKPVIGIHHMEGHIMANHVTHAKLESPYLCLVASGGHTCLLHVKAPFVYEMLGQTRDDAAGEAFDKAARTLGLPYPGGPNLEALAKGGNEKAFKFTRPRIDNPYDFSFSGLKTAVISLLHNAAQRGQALNLADVAASFQASAIGFLLQPAFGAAKDLGIGRLSMAGGVLANTALRERAKTLADEAGVALYLPEKRFCTDNAVMIAEAARRRLRMGQTSEMTLNAIAYMPLERVEKPPSL
jgi:N6-L-threonylcarbamoyladenine synthase